MRLPPSRGLCTTPRAGTEPPGFKDASAVKSENCYTLRSASQVFRSQAITTSLPPCTASEPLFAGAQKGAKNALSVCCSNACTPGRTACLVSFLNEVCAPNAPDSASRRRRPRRLSARTWRRASDRAAAIRKPSGRTPIVETGPVRQQVPFRRGKSKTFTRSTQFIPDSNGDCTG